MKNRSRTAAAVVTAAALMAGSFYAGMAHAADARFDQVEDLLKKAIALTKTIENPGPQEFGGHKAKAIKNMEEAIEQIEKAKKFQDKHTPPPRPTASN